MVEVIKVAYLTVYRVVSSRFELEDAEPRWGQAPEHPSVLTTTTTILLRLVLDLWLWNYTHLFSSNRTITMSGAHWQFEWILQPKPAS